MNSMVNGCVKDVLQGSKRFNNLLKCRYKHMTIKKLIKPFKIPVPNTNDSSYQDSVSIVG